MLTHERPSCNMHSPSERPSALALARKHGRKDARTFASRHAGEQDCILPASKPACQHARSRDARTHALPSARARKRAVLRAWERQHVRMHAGSAINSKQATIRQASWQASQHEADGAHSADRRPALRAAGPAGSLDSLMVLKGPPSASYILRNRLLAFGVQKTRTSLACCGTCRQGPRAAAFRRLPSHSAARFC